MEVQKLKLKENNILVAIFGNEIDKISNKITGNIELDIENQMQFIEHINTIIDDGHHNIIISMNNISYIDSSGLWAIFESHKKIEQRNGKIVLLKPKKDVKRVLDITKISTKITICETKEDAIAHFNN